MTWILLAATIDSLNELRKCLKSTFLVVTPSGCQKKIQIIVFKNMSKPDTIIFFRPVCRICTATIPWQHARATSSAKTARHPKNMAANSEPMGRKMKLSPPTTKTQKPQRYLTLLYRHLGHARPETVVDYTKSVSAELSDFGLRRQLKVESEIKSP
jgi:hypothetical protein